MNLSTNSLKVTSMGSRQMGSRLRGVPQTNLGKAANSKLNCEIPILPLGPQKTCSSPASLASEVGEQRGGRRPPPRLWPKSCLRRVGFQGGGNLSLPNCVSLVGDSQNVLGWCPLLLLFIFKESALQNDNNCLIGKLFRVYPKGSIPKPSSDLRSSTSKTLSPCVRRGPRLQFRNDRGCRS